MNRSLILLGARCALALGLSASGMAPAEEAAPAPNLVPLTRDGALVSAMTYYRGVEVARFGPQIANTFAPEARAAFDPVLLATISYGRDKQPNLSTSFQSSTPSTLGAPASTTDPVAAAASLVSALARLNNSFNKLHANDEVTTDNLGTSLSLTERLPTGTQLFITGMTDLNDISPGDNRNTGDLTVGITQPLLRGFGVKANLVALRQAQNTAAQSEETFRRALLGTARDVELGYWQLVFAEELVKIRSFAVTLADEQVKRTQGFLDVGKAIRGDVMAAQADRATRKADLAGAIGEWRNRNIDLVRLMNPEGAPNWDAQFAPQDPADAVEVSVDPAQSTDAALEHRPELKEAGFDIANLHLDVVREKNNRLPRLDLVGSVGNYSAGSRTGDATNGLFSNGPDHYSVGIQFEMPIARRAEKARYTRAKLASAQGEASVRQLEDAITSDVRQAVVNVQQQWARLAATKEAVESRGEELRIAQGRYEVGKVTNLDVLQVQRDLIQAQVDDASARIGYLQTLTRLYAAEGTLLDRRGIAVEQYAEEK